MPSWHEVAVRNNAALCDMVCRTHGLEPRFGHAMWTSATRTPNFYPDAVSLVAAPDVNELLARIDDTTGASIKDSFAALDMRAHGYEVLFDATWIVAKSSPELASARDGWSVVTTEHEFEEWKAAWRADEASDVLLPALLDHSHVAVLAKHDGGEIVAGAIVNRSGDVLGVSNVFTTVPSDWASMLRFVRSFAPGAALVGYESGNALAAALEVGFVGVGNLRVWMRPPQAD